jgi:DNA-binding CsgD family transcriptional regulator
MEMSSSSISPLAFSLDNLKTSASSCRSPKSFRKLLDATQGFLPFQCLVCVWGHQSRKSIRFIFNHSFPVEFVRWYLTEGVLWRGPLFLEWQRTNRAQFSVDVWRRLAKRMDPDILENARRFNLKCLLAGGTKTPRVWIFFVMSMQSDKQCRTFKSRFESVVPVLAKALQQACPRPLLTERETEILELRTMGKITKQIASMEGINVRTVRAHLQGIKKKLFTDDLLNATVIALRSGMIRHTGLRRTSSYSH